MPKVSKIKHIVGVYKIEDGEPVLLNRKYKHEFAFEVTARNWAKKMNEVESRDGNAEFVAMYEIEYEYE